MATQDYLDHEEKDRLLRFLRNMTQRGTISWEAALPTENEQRRGDLFIAVLEKNFGFRLSSVDRDGVAPYRLEVFRRGEEKGVLGDPIATIQMVPIDEGGDDGINHLIDDLYMEVARRVMRPEESIRELFEVIQRIDPDPPF